MSEHNLSRVELTNVPLDLKSWAVAEAAHCPDEFFSATEVWIKALREFKVSREFVRGGRL